MTSPFAISDALAPGHGVIHLDLLPPSLPRLRTVQYQYPLKLISPAPVAVDDLSRCLVHTVYVLTYGGGLVAGDSINLHAVVADLTRLVLLTQGSTKIFKSPDVHIISTQITSVDVHGDGALCYLPDPVQPFESSCFTQQQIYNVSDATKGGICVLDWVSNGRAANGEDWSFHKYASRNEIFTVAHDHSKRLLLRDNLLLESHGSKTVLPRRMHGSAVTGTLILHGQLFHSLAKFFSDEFRSQPRIGGRTWDDMPQEDTPNAQEIWRTELHHRQSETGLLWSAASVRGVTVVKFCAPQLEHVRHWLHNMLEAEGTVVSKFGERALLCLR